MTNDYQELFQNLSKDPYMASFELLTQIDAKVLGSRPSENEYSAACRILEAFYEANNFKIPKAIAVSWSFGVKEETADNAIQRTREGWRLQYEAFRQQILANHRHAVKQAAKNSIAAVSAEAFGYATLNDEEKTSIHKHIEKIRKIIEQSNLDDRKKNSLFNRLSSLSSDVDRNGTRTDRFFAFASEISFCVGDFAENAKPMFDEVKEVLRIVCRARSRNEGSLLPPGDSVLSLPEPSAKS
ncbi:MAG TPA: hypothetical protein VL402_08305 [Xanthobacteraceae bacterium]|jgi:hypothetical protein|nr:hypothetical protein [Xanthobacteraceae bacterium]